MNQRYLLPALTLLAMPCWAHQQWSAGRPDGHAPIGVMGDHTHNQGEWMLSYRYMTMNMEGNRDGTEDVSIDEVLDDYSVAPVDMQMDMHMVGAMYAVNDRWTLMGMASYLDKTMNLRTRMGADFETATSGFSDLKLSALVDVWSAGMQKIHLNLGVSLPTGATDERGDTPMGEAVKLPYPMQLGSGTIDWLPGVTYLGQHGDWSWGAQGLLTWRTGDNDEGYRLGNEWQLNAWTGLRLSDAWSTSVRLNYRDWSNIEGSDDELNPMMVPTADPDLRAGSRLDAGLGFNYYCREGAFAGHRLALEYIAPMHQDLEGPQMKVESSWVLGWQLAF